MFPQTPPKFYSSPEKKGGVQPCLVTVKDQKNSTAWKKVEVHLNTTILGKAHNDSPTRWWLNQPIWKICSSKWKSSPNRGENKKNWNHQPAKYQIVFSGHPSHLKRFFWEPAVWSIGLPSLQSSLSTSGKNTGPECYFTHAPPNSPPPNG